MHFNPLKSDVAWPDLWYPTTSTAVVLGVTFSDDCSFGPNVTNLVRKRNYALRSLTSLRRLGFSIKQLLLAYTCYVGPLLEYTCPVWGPQVLYIDLLNDELEAVQKRALKIILGIKYVTYDSALVALQIPILKEQRYQLMCKFGHSVLSSDKHRSLLSAAATVNRTHAT